MHYCKEHTYKKLRVWGVQKCKPCVSAKSVQTFIYQRNYPFPAKAYSPTNGNSRKFTANPSQEQFLHYCKEHTYKKLRVWGVQKCKPCVSAKSVQTFIYQRNYPFPAKAYSPTNGNSRKFTANPSQEQFLHYCKEHTYKKLRVWGVQKCKPCVSAKSAPTVIYPRIYPFPATAYSATNGNSLKFTANSSQEQSLH